MQHLGKTKLKRQVINSLCRLGREWLSLSENLASGPTSGALRAVDATEKQRDQARVRRHVDTDATAGGDELDDSLVLAGALEVGEELLGADGVTGQFLQILKYGNHLAQTFLDRRS